MSKGNLNFYKILLIATFFLLLVPDCIKKVPEFSIFYDCITIILFLLFVVLFAFSKRKEKITPFEVLILTFHLYLLIISVLSGNSTYTNNLTIINQLTLCLVIFANGKERFQETYSAIIFVTTVLILINFISLFVSPNGLNIFYTGYGTATSAWLLGTKNPSARFVVISLCLRLYYKNIFCKNKNIVDLIMIIIGFISVVKLESATGIVSLVAMTVLIKIAEKNTLPINPKYTSIFAGAAGISALIIFCNIQKFFSEIIINILHRDISFTNRTIIWSKSIEAIAKNPIIGYGFQSDDIMFNTLSGYHPHNFYLFILYSTGIIGMILLFFIVKEMSRAAKDNLPSKKISIVLFLSIMIMGITESLTSTPLLYLSFTIIYFVNHYKLASNNYEKES